MPPSLTGTLEDNEIELLSVLLGNLADLPTKGFFIGESSIAVGEVEPPGPGVLIPGTPWGAIVASLAPSVQGHPWGPLDARVWPTVREP